MVAGSSSDALLRVGRVLHGTLAEGPGTRTAIWMQGCSIRCKGCINPHLFNAAGGEAVDPIALAADAAAAGVEGITLLGGEPFDQARACARLARAARERGLGVICFTGYEWEHLAADVDASRLLEEVDLLVDGPYVAGLPETERALVGSRNQRFIHITDRYVGFDPGAMPNRIELRIEPNGEVRIAGFLTTESLSELASSASVRRSQLRRRPTSM